MNKITEEYNRHVQSLEDEIKELEAENKRLLVALENATKTAGDPGK